MNLEEQKENLISIIDKNGFLKLKVILSLILVALVGSYLWTKEIGFLLLGLFVGFIGFCSKQTSLHISHAVEALRVNDTTSGTVKISFEDWSESRTYFAEVKENNQPEIWKFEFIPIGWKPSPGEYTCLLYHHARVPWPTLVEIPSGILYPRTNPEQL